MSDRRADLLAALLTAAVVLIFGVDLLAWSDLSDSWLHTDSTIHFDRTRIFARDLGGPRAGELQTLVGYGPLPYLLGAVMMRLEGTATVGAMLHGMLIFSALGAVGTALAAARIAGRWCAPVAAALLLGLPVWRTHTMDLMVDLPGAALAILAVGLLLWSDGLERKAWLAGAALVTGLALVTRWPAAFLLVPAWGLALLHAGWRAGGPPWRPLVGLLPALGAVTLPLLPLLLGARAAPLPLLILLPLALAALGGWLLFRPPGGRASWWLRSLAAGLLLAAPVLAMTLWAPEGLMATLHAQLELEAAYDPAGASELPLPQRAWRAITVIVAWQSGPVVAVAALLALLLALVRPPWPRRRLVAVALLLLPAAVNFVAILETVGEPDERHALSSLPALVACAGALPGLVAWRARAGRALGWLLGGALGAVGLLGILAWHFPALPGVVSAEPWHQDINMVRGEPRLRGLEGGAPWASLLPHEASSLGGLAEALEDELRGSPACWAWLLDDQARRAVRVVDLVRATEALIMDRGGRAMAEDILDRQGSRPADYDGVVVMEPADGALLGWARCALPGWRELVSLEYEGFRVTALWPGGPPPGRDCMGLFPSQDLLPPGMGWDQRGGLVPGEPPLDAEGCP